ncbi:MAG: single-stranded DNA-binding protein [Deltaproteobacteria bacterium]|nr:single-stranded DNA-binding protein [Deltaproteobacteria bacterium]
MGSVNKVILVGNLGRDPELRYTQDRKPVVNFSLATQEVWTGKDGQRTERTEWHSIVVWGKLAEICKDYLTTGRQIYVEGRLATRSYTDKSGQKRYKTEIIASQVVFLGPAPQGQELPKTIPQMEEKESPIEDINDMPIDDDDIPF